MKSVESLLVEFDLNNCEEMSPPMRRALHNAFLLGVSGGALLATEVFASCFNGDTLDRTLFRSSMDLIAHDLTERAAMIGAKRV